MTTLLGHPIAEEVDVQVYCNNQMIARAPFTFYEGTDYEVNCMLQYINQYMPQFFTPGFNPSVLGGSNQDGSDGFSHGMSVSYAVCIIIVIKIFCRYSVLVSLTGLPIGYNSFYSMK